jgi:serine/threonine protein kinase
MRQIVNGEPFNQLKNQSSWDEYYLAFVKACLEKDPKKRLNAENLLKNHSKFFNLAKDKKYIRENLLASVPSVEERVSFYLTDFKFEKGIVYYQNEKEEILEGDNSIQWNFDLNESDIRSDFNFNQTEKNLTTALVDTKDNKTHILSQNNKKPVMTEKGSKSIQARFQNCFDEV